jgi:diguanylate cyclase (GGDEF)-like protein
MASANELLARTATVAEAQAALGGLVAIAFTDPTTGLHNRRALDEITKLSLAFEGKIYGALMIDLTEFKQINDGAGHAAGDAALRRVGETLLGMCRHDGPFAGALPFRYGGDEFCVLVPSAIFQGFIESQHLAGLAWLDFTVQGRPLGFGASIGIAGPDGEIEMVQLIARADIAAKASKDNRDEPVLWSAAIEHGPTASPRKRCGSCSAKITIHVAQAKLVADGFKTCPNCGGALA